jgi:hypothetical protein
MATIGIIGKAAQRLAINGVKITGFGVITTQGTIDGGEASSVMTWAIDVAETAPPKKTPGVILFAG